MKIDQNFTRNPMDPSDLAYYAWFKSCASFFSTCSELGTAHSQLVLPLFAIFSKSSIKQLFNGDEE